MRDLVSKQRLPKSSTSTSTRAKLTLPQCVVPNRDDLFPPELQIGRTVELNMFLKVPNKGSLPFVVTASLHKLRNGRNGVRVVLLERGWKPIVKELSLKKGDKVSIFLLKKTPPWTYSIEVERVREAPTRMIPDLNVAVPDMENNLNQPNQSERMMLDFDLNRSPPRDM